MSEDTAYKVVKLILLSLIILLFVLGYSVYSAYEGRKALVDSQRAGCERGKLDRSANAEGWRAAQVARTNTLAKDMGTSVAAVEALFPQPPKIDDPPDLVAARKYNRISSGLESRSKIDCKTAFPSAGLIP